jgi:VIT1/CCC1 family predicted Fe2+/Mn2+ transporter
LSRLESQHSSEAIQGRLNRGPADVYIGDAVLGAVDGCVTTFAIVAGSVGARLPEAVILILGGANLLADGFSMAASNYLAVKSQSERIERAREEENLHIDHIPEGEQEEIRQIFRAKGFDGETLERIVDVITADRTTWVNTMLTEEHGLPLSAPVPWRAGLATFGAFVGVGFVPLLPYVVGLAGGFQLSCLLTAAAFVCVGIWKGLVLGRRAWLAGLETLLIGSAAAAVAYATGAFLRSVVG